MKTCVFLTGTNAVGKSSLAWAIITRYGGVDRITNDKGSYCTSKLADVVEEGLRNADTIVCEGSFLNTFGLNLTNAMFKADRHLIVSLYADIQTIYSRIVGRSNGKYGDGKRNWPTIVRKQRQAMVAAQKWQSIGVPVLQFNTAETTVEYELEMMISKINELCSR